MHYKRQEINVNILEKYLTDRFTIKQIKKYIYGYGREYNFFFFLLFPSAYTAAFAGIKYIFTQIGAGEMVSVSSFVTVLIVLCGYTIIFGRFFCGFACAFGTLGDAVHAGYVWCCKKLKKKPVVLSQMISTRLSVCKYLILLMIVLMCYAGIYSKAQGTSPWDVFSMIHAGNLKLANYIPGLIILLLILVGMCVQEPFCRFYAQWEQSFPCFRYCRFFHLEETAVLAFQNAVDVHGNVLQIYSSRIMAPGKSALIVFNVRNVWMSARKVMYIVL